MNDTNSVKKSVERDFEERYDCYIVLTVIGLTLLLFFAICIYRDDLYPLKPLACYDGFGGFARDLLMGYALPIVGILCVAVGFRNINKATEDYAEIEGMVSSTK